MRPSRPESTFVRTDHYFGPERRRKTVERSDEPERRGGADEGEPSDIAADDFGPSDVTTDAAGAEAAALGDNQPDGGASEP